MQKKLQVGNLLDEKGQLIQTGYATSLVKKYDSKKIKACKSRIKEWDYYLIQNDQYAVALTIADNRYMGMLSASVIDLEKPSEKTSTIITLFTNGKTNMPETSKKGSVQVENKKAKFSFMNNGKFRKLLVEYNEFDNKDKLMVDLTIFNEPTDSMVIAIPFENKPKHFYYNQKIVGMNVEGVVKIGDKEIVFNKKNTFALLDWGRGVWPYKNTWYWGSACGMVDDKKVGFNIGYGFGDTSSASENMVFYNNSAYKLDQVTFVIPKNNKGKFDYEKPWTFVSNDGCFEMKFVPIIDRKSNTNLIILKSDQHQVFGKFSGTIKISDTNIIKITDMLGFAERVDNRW